MVQQASDVTISDFEHELSLRKFYDPLIRRDIELRNQDCATPLTVYESSIQTRNEAKGVSDAKLMGIGLAFGTGMHAIARPAIRLEIAFGTPHEQFLTDHRNAIIGGVTLLGVSTGLYLGLLSRE